MELTISGKTYSINSRYEESYLLEVAEFLDQKLSLMKKGQRGRSNEQILILAALDIIDEFFQKERQWKQERREIREQVSRLIQDVDLQIERLDPKP